MSRASALRQKHPGGNGQGNEDTSVSQFPPEALRIMREIGGEAFGDFWHSRTVISTQQDEKRTEDIVTAIVALGISSAILFLYLDFYLL